MVVSICMHFGAKGLFCGYLKQNGVCSFAKVVDGLCSSRCVRLISALVSPILCLSMVYSSSIPSGYSLFLGRFVMMFPGISAVRADINFVICAIFREFRG